MLLDVIAGWGFSALPIEPGKYAISASDHKLYLIQEVGIIEIIGINIETGRKNSLNIRDRLMRVEIPYQLDELRKIVRDNQIVTETIIAS